MASATGGKGTRPPAKKTPAKPRPKASGAKVKTTPARPRPKAGAKPRPRRKKSRAPGLIERLSGLSRLAWLGGLCLAVAGVVLVWWWAGRGVQPPASQPHPLPAASAPATRPTAPKPQPMPPAPPAQPAKPPHQQPLPPDPAPAQAKATKQVSAGHGQAQAPNANGTTASTTTSSTAPSTSTTTTTTTTSTTSTSAAPPARPRQTLPMPPAYEELEPEVPRQAELRAVDEALFAGLRRGGLEPRQIRIQVSPGEQGEVTLLEARLRPGQDQKALARALEQALKATSARLEWHGAKGLRELKVYLGQDLTHRLSLPLAAPPPEPPPMPVPGARPRVAIVIDDMGQSLEQARRLLGLDLHITLSILPQAPQARQTAELARSKGALVMAHLPMEPKGYPHTNPGPGALLTSMGPEALSRATRQALANLPGVKGANNHMGSRLSEEPEALRPVMEVLAEQGLFFLDSVTSPRSQAREQARRQGLAHGQRDVFLDHDPTAAAITQQVHRLIKLAKTQGRAIAIGHPHATTIAVLTSLAPRLKQEVELVPVSQLLSPAGQPELDSQAARP